MFYIIQESFSKYVYYYIYLNIINFFTMIFSNYSCIFNINKEEESVFR